MEFHIRKDVGRRVARRRPQRVQDAEALADWLSRPPAERIEAGAFMTRRLYWLTHGTDLPPLDKTVGRRAARPHA